MCEYVCAPMGKPSGCVSVDVRGVSLSFFWVFHWLIFTFVLGFFLCSLLFALRLPLSLRFFIRFFRHLHHSLFLSFNNHYSSRTNTHSHSSWIRSSCRQEHKSLILLNDYNIHHFSICNHLHWVINTGKWVTNRISCSALWAFRWCLLNWVISGNKDRVQSVLSSWRHFCQIKPEMLKQRIVGVCLKCFIRFEDVTVMHLLVSR